MYFRDWKKRGSEDKVLCERGGFKEGPQLWQPYLVAANGFHFHLIVINLPTPYPFDRFVEKIEWSISVESKTNTILIWAKVMMMTQSLTPAPATAAILSKKSTQFPCLTFQRAAASTNASVSDDKLSRRSLLYVLCFIMFPVHFVTHGIVCSRSPSMPFFILLQMGLIDGQECELGLGWLGAWLEF